jgi:phenylpropionate dioxygenase-like ring-hydroxylating dioxygenase large terminal subunit
MNARQQRTLTNAPVSTGRDRRLSPRQRPDWQQAHGPSIQRALDHACSKDFGGWYVLGEARQLKEKKPARHVVNNVELVSWNTASGVSVAPAACPHLGAHLADGHVRNDRLVCPWHGLTLPGDGQGRWSPIPVHNDGVFLWVQLGESDDLSPRPFLPKRPTRYIDAVIRREVRCEPRDVIANRLDPWHGVHFHPYAFANLEVLDHTDDYLDLRVAYRVTGKHRIEVQARFDCPDPRTIVMTITDGEGVGSVVETHATPIVTATPRRAPRTAVIEATLATSDRPGFSTVLRGASLARPVIRYFANRLWRDDAKYAERTYDLRRQQWKPGDRSMVDGDR